MAYRKRGRKNSLFSTGQWNRIVDAAVHPLYAKSKAFIFLDGALHALNEQDPLLSAAKFAKYSVPELLKTKAGPKVTLKGNKRRYSCALPVNCRYMICRRKKAGSCCLKTGVWRAKCPKLTISYR